MTSGNGSFSVLRSLFIDNETPQPEGARGNNQFVNNVVYNWTTAAYIMGGDVERRSIAPTPRGTISFRARISGSAAFSGGNTDYHLFASGNFYDSNRNGSLDGSVLTQPQYGSGIGWPRRIRIRR